MPSRGHANPRRGIGVSSRRGWAPGASESKKAVVRIIEATNKRALERVMAHGAGDDRAFERRVRAIVDGVRRGGDKALRRFARRFDHATPPLDVTADEMREQAARVAPDVLRAI